MLHAPLVSVVVPFLNPGEFLRECVESVMAQTYPHWELLLVDDGSTDGSPAIAGKFAAANPGRVTVLQHPAGENRGMPASRNLGLSRARGEFIASLDSDDVFLPDKLERQLGILGAHPECSFTFARMEVWSSWQVGRKDSIQNLTCPVGSPIAPPRFIPWLLSGRNDPQGALMRKADIDKVGGWVESISMCEDWAMYIKLALRWAVIADGKPNYRYRQHASQTCAVHRRAGTFHSSFAGFFDWLERYLSEQQVNDAEIRRAVRYARWRNAASRTVESWKKSGKPLADAARRASTLADQ